MLTKLTKLIKLQKLIINNFYLLKNSYITSETWEKVMMRNVFFKYTSLNYVNVWRTIHIECCVVAKQALVYACVCVQTSRCTAVKTVMSCSLQHLSCGGIRSIRAPVLAPSLTHWETTSNRNVRTAMILSMSVKTVRRSFPMSTGEVRPIHCATNVIHWLIYWWACVFSIKSGTTHDSSHRREGVQVRPVPQSLQLEVQPHPSPDVTWQWQALWVWKLW